MGEHKTPAILVIEDNDDDFEATERALCRGAATDVAVQRCHDGLEAWEFLKATGRYATDPQPCPALVLLDLNMPGLDGRRLLARIKGDEALCHIPVVVMTTSEDQKDVRQCYRTGANTYLRKPLAWSSFAEAMQSLRSYWFQTATLPEGDGPCPRKS